MLLSRSGASERGHGGYAVVAGTTASGKSALALALAEQWNGVVINADSVQLYRSLPTLTAQPSDAQLARAPHALYGILSDHERCSVARWLDLAARAIRDAQPRLAIVTGGTGFYLEALLHGLAETPPTPPELRSESQALMDALGRDRFAAELAERDPELVAAGLPRDRQRLMRAWEVRRLTGQSILRFRQTRRRADLPRFRGGVALMPPAGVTRARISQRLSAMLAAGALAEVQAFRADAAWPASPLAKADGVRELSAYLDGTLTLPAAIEATEVKVRRYAKRQRTWLRHRLDDLERRVESGEQLAAALTR